MSERKEKVGVSLLTCNLAERRGHVKATEFTLRSLLDSDLQETDWRLQIVDNGSTCRETLKLLRELNDSRIAVYFSAVNLGIAAGRNLAYQMLQWHEPKYVVEVHTDHVFTHNWLMWLLNFFNEPEHARVGILGASLVTGGGEWLAPKFALSYDASYEDFRRELESIAGMYARPNYVVPGLSHPCVIRWTMVEALNERDEENRLCVYDPLMPGRQNFEDTEFCYRAHLAGWQSMINFGSVCYHHYHYTRCDGDLNIIHAQGYDANNIYVQQKHGQAFLDWSGKLGRQLERAYVGQRKCR
jgi:glycosyltransferase involved in cell wall biosynthesis